MNTENMDKILITGLIVNGTIGVGEIEREYPQELLIDVEIEYPLEKAGKSDDINDSINYSSMAKLIRKVVRETQHFLLEALAASIVEAIFDATPAQAVTLRIEKANFVSKTAKVGIQIRRQRSLKP